MAMACSTTSTALSPLEMACAKALLLLKYGSRLEPSQASSPPQETEEGTAARNLPLEPTVTLTPSQIKSMKKQIHNLQSQVKMQQAEIRRLRLKDKKYLLDDSDEEYEVERKRKKNKYNANKSKEEVEIVLSGMNVQEANGTEDSAECSESKNKLRVRNDTVNGDLVPIGDGYAKVPARLLKTLNWSIYTTATRKLLTAVFSRRVLATHSLTGKPSPAFPDKPAKKQLDPNVVNDIVQTVAEKCHVPESMIRTIITTKLADESKMLRTREQNKRKIKCENIPPSSSDSDE